jgi:hypothetical protein
MHFGDMHFGDIELVNRGAFRHEYPPFQMKAVSPERGSLFLAKDP